MALHEGHCLCASYAKANLNTEDLYYTSYEACSYTVSDEFLILWFEAARNNFTNRWKL